MATKINLTMDQGSEFLNTFRITSTDSSVSLAGYTGACQIRKHAGSSVGTSINVEVMPNGTLKLDLPSTATSAIEPGRYVYDVEITDETSKTYRVLEGIMTVTAEITR